MNAGRTNFSPISPNRAVCRLISLLPLIKPSGEEAGADIILSFVRLAVGGTAFGILCGLIGARVLHKI